jgi:hypothetical protein
MNNLMKIAVTLAFFALASGNLPKILRSVRVAQFNLSKTHRHQNGPKQ